MGIFAHGLKLLKLSQDRAYPEPTVEGGVNLALL
jgi:hypothetical protein